VPRLWERASLIWPFTLRMAPCLSTALYVRMIQHDTIWCRMTLQTLADLQSMYTSIHRVVHICLQLSGYLLYTWGQCGTVWLRTDYCGQFKSMQQSALFKTCSISTDHSLQSHIMPRSMNGPIGCSPLVSLPVMCAWFASNILVSVMEIDTRYWLDW